MENNVRFKLHKVKKHWVTVAASTTAFMVVSGATQSVAAEDIRLVVNNQGGNVSATVVGGNPNVNISVTHNGQPVNIVGQDNNSNWQTGNGNVVIQDGKIIATNGNQTTVIQDGKVIANNGGQVTVIQDGKVTANQGGNGNNQVTVIQDGKVILNQGGNGNQQIEMVQENLKDQSGRLVSVNGQVFFYDNATGQPRKNFYLQDKNGKAYYFDNDGVLQNSTNYQFEEGLGKQSHPGNGFFSEDSKSIENVDQFLTADTWYRPKEILRDGKNWEPSTEADFRPLLMVWWPDKVTKVNFVNYMNQVLGFKSSYNNGVSQSVLDGAASELQRRIEEKISREGSTSWLRDSVSKFVKTQPAWNSETENVSTGHLQGGALLYENNSLTDYANSNYRLLNRTPTRQDGNQNYHKDGSWGGYEFLLANDIDNSNPAVQAEQLNWLHFMMNFGSIVANDPKANFDGVRVDAVDNVNADLLQIASDYFKAHYGVADSEANALAHLSILEAWSDNDAIYNKDTKGAQLPMDNPNRLSLLYSLTAKIGTRSGVEPLVSNSINDRSANGKNNERWANYNFVRAHDSEVQTRVAQIIRERINPKTDGYTFTLDELARAFKIYNADMNSVEKQYTHYNIPAAYALLLTNKDTVPRVYYGDLYTDDGQYMATKSPYHAAIDALMRARIKYAAGGQDMNVVYPSGATTTGWDHKGIVTSVRYGKGANNAGDYGTAETRTQGMAVVVGNNPTLRLGNQDKVRINMGAAHKNQQYRPLLLATKDGLKSFVNDADVPSYLLKTTDSQGYLTLDKNDIQGFADVQVNGYLGVWVPVGASANQDARTAASTAKRGDGQVYTSSAALDSQLMYEGFSNFQDFVKDASQYMNKKIVEFAGLFKEWGITSFEMPPQYVSSKDQTFLDSIIDNGYAFTDRYDMAISKDNKYGSKDDLLNALRALHDQGIQAIADWVPDQIYNLPGKEVVTATRTDNFGFKENNAKIDHSLYVANSKSSGHDLQARYGGAFLDELKAKYPSIFNRKQVSTGKTINADEKITQWSAKYMNGTNILGRGNGYVLKDKNNRYYNLRLSQKHLPALTGMTGQGGFIKRPLGMTYETKPGVRAKNSFIQDAEGNWYYFNGLGFMVRGAHTISGKQYFFLPNGVQLRNAVRRDANGNERFYDSNGVLRVNDYFTEDGVNWRYYNNNGDYLKGLQTLKGQQQYFDNNGYQVKGRAVRMPDAKIRYFDGDSGNMVKNKFAMDLSTGAWYYLDRNGVALLGAQTIDGKTLYFDREGKQVKGRFVTDGANRRYYDANSGEMARNKFAQVDGAWYYFDNNGNVVKGLQNINGQLLYFDNEGRQVKGQYAGQGNNRRYYDANSGEMVRNKFAQIDGAWHYFNANGQAVTGQQYVNGQTLYFDNEGRQVKGRLVTEGQDTRYYDANSGEMAIDKFVLIDGAWYYFDRSGKAVKGVQYINGQTLYFDNQGRQVKGRWETVNGRRVYFDANSGQADRSL